MIQAQSALMSMLEKCEGFRNLTLKLVFVYQCKLTKPNLFSAPVWFNTASWDWYQYTQILALFSLTFSRWFSIWAIFQQCSMTEIVLFIASPMPGMTLQKPIITLDNRG